jgi:uncharacterized cupin superfamily protein
VSKLGLVAEPVSTGVSRVKVGPGHLHSPSHCHSAEEEIFVVLDGTAMLELTPSPTLIDQGRQPESHELRPGAVVSRTAGTRVSHVFRAGPDGLTLLAYGQRRSDDVIYSRSNKINFRGVGVIARLEHVSYPRRKRIDDLERGTRALPSNPAGSWPSQGCFHDPSRGRTSTKDRAWHG